MGISAVPADVLDGANRFAGLLASQLAGQPLPALARRLKSAIVRDDPSELLALSMVLTPVLAGKIDNPQEGDDLMTVYEVRDALRQITSRWRDTSLDGTLDKTQEVARKLVDLDSAILRGYQERTGDAEPFGFLKGMS